MVLRRHGLNYSSNHVRIIELPLAAFFKNIFPRNYILEHRYRRYISRIYRCRRYIPIDILIYTVFLSSKISLLNWYFLLAVCYSRYNNYILIDHTWLNCILCLKGMRVCVRVCVILIVDKGSKQIIQFRELEWREEGKVNSDFQKEEAPIMATIV